MLSTQQPDDDSGYIFVAKLDNARNVSTILKAIHFKDMATVFVTAQGLKVTVEDAKCVQANAFVQAAIFHHFLLTQDQVTFKINLSVLIECLTIFGSGTGPNTATSVKMCYAGYGSPLVLVLEEDGVLTDCSLKTLDPDEVLDFDFCSTNVINKIIMKSECLKEVFNELDVTSEVLQILMSPDAPYLQLSTFGSAGSTHSSFLKESDMVEAFQCTQTQSSRYKMQLLRPSSKALALSTRISMRTDARGFLSLQYMIRNEDGQICFVEYFCAPDEEMTEADPDE
ncbi:cell cycle checkpoint protein RAD1-like [Pomacea canaliculata]|uniref:cell cycle checkpoint protein RAD1-like n=1 Tax=Pomacea canaliculata TaxID=400727 RepID=UPI000D73100F|nr:cell cycle checkpoint protein RAD1-like [Pomacea canaliculata]